MICLDTNVMIAVMRGVAPIRLRLESVLVAGEPVAAPAIFLFELWIGVRKSARPLVQEQRLNAILGLGFEVLDFDQGDAMEAGEIRAALEKEGRTIGPYDLLIAAQARRRRSRLATADLAEFRRVPALEVAAWASV